ncbi:MAG: QueT transporter family protein [Oscillospiraceae bacterium]|jgi:uncharacterized membrane protein|nr:QueT transporter family protein [Oscillospiraceae bacterium]
MRKPTTNYIARAAVIAAAYTALTLIAAYAGLAYGEVQFRFSEALTILPALTSAAIPGLTIGCFVSNLIGLGIGSTMPIDLLFGTAATLLAAVFTRMTRKVTFKGMPWLSALFPVVFNALIVGWELTFFLPDETFLMCALLVGLGELVCCVGGGIPLFAALKRVPSLREQWD